MSFHWAWIQRRRDRRNRGSVGLIALCILGAGNVARAEDADLSACKGSDPQLAIPACTRILDTHPAPDIAELAWRLRGFRQQAKGEHAKAVADFSESIRLRPDHYATLTARGTSYVRLNDFEHATADFDAALQLMPNFAPAFTGRSMLDFFAGHMAQAIADASEAIRLDPKQVAAYNNRGLAFRESGNFDAALNDLNVAIRLSPYASRPLYNRGLTYLRKGDLDHALSDYNAALALDPKDTDAARGRDVVIASLAARAPQASQPSQPAPTPPPENEGGSMGGSLAPAVASGRQAGSRPAAAGSSWVPFEAKTLGLRLLVEQSTDPKDRATFSERGGWLEVRAGRTGSPTRIIRVLDKPQEQRVEDAIEEQFIAGLPLQARQSCRVVQAQPPADAGPGKLLFEIRPTDSYGQRMEARARQEPDARPDALGCGPFGAAGGTSYFEYHAGEDQTRYLYVFTGFEQPFDEHSIQVVPRLAPAGPAPVEGVFVGPGRIATVAASAEPGTLTLKLHVETPGGCSGDADGSAPRATGRSVAFAVLDPSGGPTCTLNLGYGDAYGSVEVKEAGACLTWHGAQCNFEGRLTRRH